MFDWNDLRAFLAVARTGSTLGAAKSLSVNQTTVARRLEALEQALTLKLFERGQTGSRLTEAGQDLLAEAEKVEKAVQALANRAAAHGRGMAGSIRVTATEILANLVVTPALGEFRRLYPDIHIQLELTDRTLDLRAGEADIALRSGFALQESDLIARKLGEFTFALYCSRSYAARRGAPRSLEELAQHDLIGGDSDMSNFPGLRWMFEQAPGVEPITRSNTMTNMMHAVRGGLGIAPVGTLIADADPELIRLHTLPGPPASAWIVTRPELRDAARVRAFIDFLVPHFATMKRAMQAQGAAVRERVAAELAQAEADNATRIDSPA